MATTWVNSEDKLTLDVIKSAVAKDKGLDKSQVDIVTHETGRGAPIGDNFATDTILVIVKARLDGKTEEDLEYFVKLTPVDKIRIDMMGQNIYKREHLFYRTLAQDLQAIRVKANLPPLVIPKLYFEDEAIGVIVLENMKKRGYQTPMKSARGLNSDVLSAILVALGEYHATGYHYIHSYEGGAKQFEEDNPPFASCSFFDNMPGEQTEHMFTQTLDALSKVLESGGGKQNAEMAEKLAAQKHCWKKTMDDMFKLKDGDFLTLLHGDAWFKNALLRMDGADDCNHAILIDFQMGNVGCPYADLNYLLGTSAFPADLKEHLNSWLRIYHESFIKTMMILGYPESIYTFAQLKKDFQRGRYFGIFMNLFQAGLMVVTPDSENASDFDMTSSEGQEDFQVLIDKMMSMVVAKVDAIPYLRQRIVDACTMAIELGLF